MDTKFPEFLLPSCDPGLNVIALLDNIQTHTKEVDHIIEDAL